MPHHGKNWAQFKKKRASQENLSFSVNLYSNFDFHNSSLYMILVEAILVRIVRVRVKASISNR